MIKLEQNKNHFLDLLRSIAVILVFIGHYIKKFEFDGVDIFFVLSGFLVAQSLFHYEDKLPLINYIKNRAIKILPSYIIFFVLSFFAFHYLNVVYKINDWIPLVSEFKQYFLFYRNYGGPPARQPFEHLWSISCEVQFYTILLITYIFFKKNISRLKTIWILILIFSILIKFQSIFTNIAEWPTYTHNRIDAFSWGVIAFLLPNLKFNKSIGLYIICFLIFLWCQTDYLTIDIHKLINRTLMPIIIFVLIKSDIQLTNKWVINVSKNIAKYSYNVYLWHFFILYILKISKFEYQFVMYLGFTIFLSFIFTELIECPFLRLKNRSTTFG